MHALVIENQYFLATLIEDELRQLGFTTVAIAGSQEEAIRLASEQCPDFITADQRLTSGTGVEAIRVICETRQIPVVFISGYGEEVSAAIPDAIVLSKPFNANMLRRTVSDALANSSDGNAAGQDATTQHPGA